MFTGITGSILYLCCLSVWSLSIYLFVRYTFPQFSSDRYQTTRVYVLEPGGVNVLNSIFEFQSVWARGTHFEIRRYDWSMYSNYNTVTR
jgi:hypothetical protein